MTLYVPDPHPGRCQNLRMVTHSDGYIENLRCLDYEGTEHVCQFPEPEHSIYSAQEHKPWVRPKPKPWVRPENFA